MIIITVIIIFLFSKGNDNHNGAHQCVQPRTECGAHTDLLVRSHSRSEQKVV